MMKKVDLIKLISSKTELTKKDTESVVNALFETITDELKKGEKIVITGFGTFETRFRKARDGRNPKTGETIKIPEQNTPAFKAGKSLKDAVK